ncbi:hypothetical protein AMS68_004800 [Peltaster fructicola]|uniref:mannan endo-1,6-alpha-mannosidase n=1 Tax=Peltaster fructicola TaxID=286661 RepID=A0A6H0XX08_9PEZI|nr:hypothetical protein AMS68_004800 [Peltaster fructicola]
MALFLKVVSLAAVLSQTVNALDLDTSSSDSIKNAATTIAGDLIKLYPVNSTSNDSIGLFGTPYYFWEDGAVWGALIDYYIYTNDSTYKSLVSQALLAQKGSNNDYMPVAQTKDLGNDDQSTWALACLDAVEYGFPNPAGSPPWLELATNVWNEQAKRWDNSSCQGGIRWQIYSFNNGYDYKNSATNGQFFLLSARLARITGNSTYSQWADTTYNWLSSIGLIDSQGNVYDGTDSTTNCSSVNHLAWSYNGAGIVFGSSVLYNYTNGSSVWRDRVLTLTNATVGTFASKYSNVM